MVTFYLKFLDDGTYLCTMGAGGTARHSISTADAVFGITKRLFLRCFRKLAEFFPPVFLEGNVLFLGFQKGGISFFRELCCFLGRIFAGWALNLGPNAFLVIKFTISYFLLLWTWLLARLGFFGQQISKYAFLHCLEGKYFVIKFVNSHALNVPTDLVPFGVKSAGEFFGGQISENARWCVGLVNLGCHLPVERSMGKLDTFAGTGGLRS